MASGQEVNVGNAQNRILLDRQKGQSHAECQAEIKKHEFQANEDRRSVQKLKLLRLSRKNFIALKRKNFNDEIKSFIKDNYCSKIWNYVKLVRKVSVKWKS